MDRQVLKMRPGFWAATFIERIAKISKEEILRRSDLAKKARASTPQGQSDIQLAIRLMDEELMSRISST